MNILSLLKGAPKRALIGGALATSLAVGTIGGYEGLRTEAYRDVVGIPTVCFGETKGVRMGDRYSKAQCDAMLVERLAQDFELDVVRCVRGYPNFAEPTRRAMLSLSYNIGTGAFCKSTVARKANAGDMKGACNAFLAWDKAGGRKIAGLSRRRAEERLLCLEGVGK